MAVDPDVTRRLKPLEARVTAVEARVVPEVDLSGITARLGALEAWKAAMEGEVEPPVEPEEPVAPTAFRRVRDYGIDYNLAFGWNDPAISIYLPNWSNGVMSMNDPTLIVWNDDGSATLNAEARADAWHMGALQLNRPKRAVGRVGAIIQATNPSAVLAFFGYASNGKEIDFELTWRNGVAGWTPAVHMPRAAGGVAHSSRRVMRRVAASGAKQTLEYDLRTDRCDFYADGVLFETIRPADMSDPTAWDATTPMALFLSVEKHGGWAGWPEYTSAQMVVHAINEGTGVIEAETTPPMEPEIPTDPAADPSPITINGIRWAFAAEEGASAGAMNDSKTLSFRGPGKASAKGVCNTVPGQSYVLRFDVGGYLSVASPSYGWAGLSTQSYERPFTATAATHTISVVGERADASYLSNVVVEAVT